MDAPVVIAGAGPVGLGLALSLARFGVPSLVLEARDAAPNESRAPAVLPRTLEIARSWGALDALLDAGQRVDVLAPIVVGEAEPRVRLDLSELADVCATPYALILPQAETERVLAEAAARTGLVEVRRGAAVESFAQDADGVTVRVAGGDRLRAGFLVGCDGARSAVRAGLGLALEGRTYPVQLALADVRVDDARDALPWPRLAPVSKGALAALRIAPGLWRLIYTVDGDPGPLAPRVAAVLGEGPFVEVWASTFRIHLRVAPRFREGRVALAGDAAHLVSPAGGMGMNAGLADADNLGWKLSRALRGGDADALLAAYDAERRGAVTGPLAHTTDRLTRAFLLSPLRPLAVRAAIAALSVPGLRRAALLRLAMLDVRYRGELIGGHGLAGARAPNVAWGAGRVHDVARRDAVVFRFGGEGEGIVGTDALARAWGARDGDFALLRPDGYLGYVGRDPRWLLRAIGDPDASLRVGSLRLA